ncbi:HAMP domain-containing histidine kinase [Shewanella sp. KX20019]|uniref:HAMP domain-containing sensor histidine kinase n=1 Tax=Shewanella sp. KX20019 TaxID=2803864 RepID=UPI0019259773|nr:HAMP domain-containing sensor histidine kinase [Shewanella sp. KX20019]QQX78804.1 HAMP domain-containing histidine kinase [Shewanella sp. KX20019]
MVLPPYLKQYVASVTEWWSSVKTAHSVWRLTRLYTGLLLSVVSILLIVLYQLSIGQMNRQQGLQIANIIAQQTLLAEQLSTEQFLEQFELQAQSSRQYILSYQTKKELIGRLSEIPTTLSQCPSLSRFPIWLDQFDELRLVSGCSQSMASGALIIAVDDESLYELKGQFISASAVALLLAVLLGIITGLVFSMRVLKRINSFNQVALQVESGQLSARVAISEQNDEYDHMALHINTMLSQLQHSFETISGITDAIAHDLRTPMSHLRQQIESEILSKRQLNLPTEQLQPMLDKLDEILFTFSAMLELTRLQQQKESNSQYFKTVNLKQIIVDAVDLIEPIAEEKQQVVNIASAEPLSIQGDATLLFRAIYNLLENASKYAGKSAQISVQLTHRGFTVSDNGPGISDIEKQKVFQRLYRIEKSRSVAGFGLGLTLVKAIIQLHNGKIELLDNKPGLIVNVEFVD